MLNSKAKCAAAAALALAVMGLAPASGAQQTKGVTVKLPGTVDLGPEIEGMAGRQLRMRMITIEPGGVFGPVHDHKDRPGLGWPEDRNTTHWLENRGTAPAVEISVDIARQPPASE
jgi:hypothetical protein